MIEHIVSKIFAAIVSLMLALLLSAQLATH